MRILFYAPMKHPDHPNPSGDRTIAREVRDMLRALGHEVEVVSQLRTLTQEHDLQALKRSLVLAQIKALTLIARYRRRSSRPDLWCTYHIYARSPDLLGPLVSQALDIPYVVVEAHVSYKDRETSFREGLALTRVALRQCDAVFWNKPKDTKALNQLVKCPLLDLPPSVDPNRFVFARPLDLRGTYSGPVIASLCLWRLGRKVASLTFLAQALTILHKRSPSAPWIAVIGGDATSLDPPLAAEAREEVEHAFAALPPWRVGFFGLVPPKDVPGFMKGCDIFAFPGLREPLGMVFLEAQAAGRPVVAVRNSGIATMVSPEGAILVDAPDPQSYANALDVLLADPKRRQRMGESALQFVIRERSQTVAQARLEEGLAKAIEHHKRCRR